MDEGASFDEFNTLTTAELVERTRTLARTRDRDDDDRWTAVAALRRRAEQGVFEHAVAWCASADARDRALGADILAQLGAPACPFAAESAPALSALLRDDDEDVVVEALYALGHLRAGPTSALTSFICDPSRRVRRAAAHALGSRTEAEAIDALVALTADSDSDVRDWATFAIGTLSEHDSPQIRDALAARLTDEDIGVRDEAMAGLARRRDPRANDLP